MIFFGGYGYYIVGAFGFVLTGMAYLLLQSVCKLNCTKRALLAKDETR